jgi:arginine exporter protein ArgO
VNAEDHDQAKDAYLAGLIIASVCWFGMVALLMADGWWLLGAASGAMLIWFGAILLTIRVLQ